MQIKVYSLYSESYVYYIVPTIEDAIENIKNTSGKVFDRIEREWVEGGVPMVWERVENE